VKELETLIDMLRAKGVTSYAGPLGADNQVSMTLGPDVAPLVEEPEPKPAEPEVVDPSDGLTKSEKALTYAAAGR
jgi:hypothetical protein